MPYACILEGLQKFETVVPKSTGEAIVLDILINNGIHGYYEFYHMPATENNGTPAQRSFSPDFTTNLILDGKLVVVEFHSYAYMSKNYVGENGERCKRVRSISGTYI